ncbi:YhgE/Pip domain-containing protein [Paucilactobacillus vaccinostercus]|nr:YhgE/Pip domain-containing protein [Paucilactobacillus vaccinostercus]
MLSNFGTPRMRRIAYIVLAVLVPAVLLIAIFNFIQYEQHAATKNIPVAVVNKDQPAESNGQLIDVGQQVVNTLKKDHQVKWEFVSEKTAKKQLADGDAYLEIELPKNFSENATTLMAKNPKVSLIKLHESKRNNFLSSMVTTTVADTVQSQVKTKVQKVYSQTLLSSLKKLGNGTKQAASGTQQLDDGMTQLKDGQTEITRNLDLLSTNMVTFESGAKTLKDGVDTYTTGVDTLTAADKQLAAGLHTLQESAEPLVSGTAQLATGSKTLSSGVKQYTDGVSQLTSGNQQIYDGLGQLNSKTGSLVSGTKQLADGSTQLSDGISQYTTGVNSVNTEFAKVRAAVAANDKIVSSIDSMTSTMQKAQTDTAQLKSDMSSLQDGLNTLTELAPLLDKISSAKTQISSLQAQMKLANMIAKTPTQIATDQGNVTSAQSALQAAIANVSDPDQKAALQSAAAAETKATTTLGSDAKNTANAYKMVSDKSTTALDEFSTELGSANLTTADAEAMLKKVQNIETEANSLFDETDPLLSSDTISKLNTVLANSKALTPALNQLQEQGFDKLTDSSTVSKLTSGASQLASGNSELANQAPTLASGVKQLFAGSSQVVAGGNQLNANTSALVSGAAQLATGNATLAASAPALISGVAQLVSGGDQIVSGGNQLTGASSQLRSGTSQIYDATVTAKSGADQLASGSHQLLDGTDTAADGVSTLNKALQDGADQIGTIHAGSSNVNHLATPISNKEEGATSESLKNTFAPLMLALVLFLGAVVTQLGLFTPERRKRHTLFEEPLLAIGLTAVAQAVIADVLLAVLGVSVASWFGLTFFSLIVSVLFTAICMTLYHMFGRVGVLFAVLLALLQIIITGQVFPNAMLSSFYQGIASILPMTHAIHGFDALINGTNYNVLLAIAFLLLFTVVLAGIAYLIDFLVAKRLTDNEEPEEK